ncbi:hypothetical protein VNI00_007277 [Paramarasmius palmivorus]|uniref:C3H1-type domain-containing protein n=1 Tax=Paramarasmius palmivorus TaxID=297713 RepID=A0AAW0D3W1_9AGAR
MASNPTSQQSSGHNAPSVIDIITGVQPPPSAQASTAPAAPPAANTTTQSTTSRPTTSKTPISNSSGIAPLTPQADVVNESHQSMHDIVNQYREGKVTRKSAEKSLEKTFRKSSETLGLRLSSDQVRDGIGGWLISLDDHDKEVKRGRDAGKSVADALGLDKGGRNHGEGAEHGDKGKQRYQSPDPDPEPSSPSSSDDDRDREDSRDRRRNHRRNHRKRSPSSSRSPPPKSHKRRRRDPSPSSSDSSSDSSSSDSSHHSSRRSSRKKPKLDKRLFPFLSGNKSYLQKLRKRHGRREVICRQLENYSRDPKEAARRIMYSKNAPPLVLDEWKTVLPGDYTDLDAIFTRMHPSHSASAIQTQSDWAEAWSYLRRGINHAFSFREDELREYEDYLLSSFRTRQSSFHANIVAFDRDNRQNVLAANKGVLFTDFHHFAQNRKAWLESTGINNTTTSSRRQNNAPRRQEICRNWNYRRCADDKSCRCRHVCLSCESPNHVRDDCKGGPSSLPKSERN